ncbi:MAG TPA: hypothetical protein VFS42_09675 [Burkholderiaceae bacterium]|nr:hypothetical protein [Burkholderiaceae bacterium]
MNSLGILGSVTAINTRAAVAIPSANELPNSPNMRWGSVGQLTALNTALGNALAGHAHEFNVAEQGFAQGLSHAMWTSVRSQRPLGGTPLNKTFDPDDDRADGYVYISERQPYVMVVLPEPASHDDAQAREARDAWGAKLESTVREFVSQRPELTYFDKAMFERETPHDLHLAQKRFDQAYEEAFGVLTAHL